MARPDCRRLSAQAPSLSFPLSSFHCVFSLSSFSPSVSPYLSVCHPSLPTCIQDAAAALSDHLAGTQLRNCASRQMPCRTVGDGGGGVMQSPSVSSCSPPLPPSFTWPPHGPHPSTPLPPAPSTLPLAPPRCHPRLVHLGPGNSGESCVCRLFPTITFNYGSLQCGLVKGLAIRTLSLSLSVSLSQSLSRSLAPSSLHSGFWPGSM